MLSGRLNLRIWLGRLALCALQVASVGAARSTVATREDKILQFDSEVTILVDSRVHVRETIHLVNGGVQFGHGLERRFMIRRHDQLGNSWSVDYRQIEVFRDGKPEIWQTRKENDEMVLHIGDPNVLVPVGEYTYVIAYLTINQIHEYGATDEFRRSVTGTWNVPIEHFAVRLHLPPGIPVGKEEISAYTSATATQLFCDCKQGVDANDTHSFATTRTLFPSEQLTIEARFPSGFIRRTAREELRSWVQNHTNVYACVIFLASIVLYYLIAFGILRVLSRKAPHLFHSDRHIAATAGAVITVLSLASLFFGKQPYGAVPGFGVGILISIVITGGAHGPDDPYSTWMFFALAVNFAFYYLLTLGLCRFFNFGKPGTETKHKNEHVAV